MIAGTVGRDAQLAAEFTHWLELIGRSKRRKWKLGAPDPTRCPHPPGSVAKMEFMRQRLKLGYALFNPDIDYPKGGASATSAEPARPLANAC